jgi:uncharacterized protein
MNIMFRILAILLVCWSFVSPAGAQRLERCYESVLLLGDSNVYGALGHSLQHDFQTNGSLVFREGKPGSGLARPDFHNWPSEARFLVEIIDPDIVVLMLGGNDIQRLRDTKGRFGEGIPWEDEDRWTREYRERMTALVEGLKAADPASSKKDRRLVILSPTNRRPTMNRERVQRIVELQREELSTRQDVHWVDAFALTTADTGRYLAKGYRNDGTVIPFRKSDGIHLTRAGADDLAVRIRNILFRGCPDSTTAAR